MQNRCDISASRLLNDRCAPNMLMLVGTVLEALSPAAHKHELEVYGVQRC